MPVAIRDAYGKALTKYGKADSRVVVLDADVGSSAKSGMFRAVCPERAFNVGIAESNMAAMAAGFAAEGFIPFVNTFATFINSLCMLSARAFGSYSNMGIKFMGAYGGLSDAYDGPSHHAIADLAIMRALPNFRVYTASDENQVDWLVKNAIEKAETPMYIRLSRDSFPVIYKEDHPFEDGKGVVVRDGSDVAIFACGIMVSKALEAAEQLSQRGISAAVIDLFCLKPFDKELLLSYAKKTKAIVTAEEHSVLGGLGGSAAEILSTEGTGAVLEMVGMEDCYAECGPYDALLQKYNLSVDAILAKVSAVLAKKEQKAL